MSHNSYPESPKPSQLAARMQSSIGDVVIYCGQPYLIASILDMTQSLTPEGPTGIHYVLRRSQWIKMLFLIVPARAIEQPFAFAA